jgi:hypothetical protein
MRNDFGKKWTQQDYGMALFCIALLLIAILLPAYLWLRFVMWVGEEWIIPSVIALIIGWFFFMMFLQLRWRQERKRMDQKWMQKLKDV